MLSNTQLLLPLFPILKNIFLQFVRNSIQRPTASSNVCKVFTLSFLPRACSIERGEAVKRTPISRSGTPARTPNLGCKQASVSPGSIAEVSGLQRLPRRFWLAALVGWDASTPPPLLSSGGEVSRSGDFSGTSGKGKSLRTETEATWPGASWELQFSCLGLLYPQAKRSGPVARVATDAGRQAGAWFSTRSVRPETLLSHLHSNREQRPLGVGAWRGAGPQVSQKPRSPRAPARLMKSRGGKGTECQVLKRFERTQSFLVVTAALVQWARF